MFPSPRHPVTKHPLFMIFPQMRVSVDVNWALLIHSLSAQSLVSYITLCRLTQAVTVLNYILQVPGWNIGQDSNLSWFYSVLSGNCWYDISIRLRQMSTKYFPICHLPLVRSFDILWPNILRVSLIKPYVNYASWSSNWPLSLERSLSWPICSVF